MNRLLLLLLVVGVSACVVPYKITATRPYAACTALVADTDTAARSAGFQLIDRQFATTGYEHAWTLLYERRDSSAAVRHLRQVHVVSSSTGCLPQVRHLSQPLPSQ